MMMLLALTKLNIWLYCSLLSIGAGKSAALVTAGSAIPRSPPAALITTRSAATAPSCTFTGGPRVDTSACQAVAPGTTCLLPCEPGYIPAANPSGSGLSFVAYCSNTTAHDNVVAGWKIGTSTSTCIRSVATLRVVY